MPGEHGKPIFLIKIRKKEHTGWLPANKKITSQRSRSVITLSEWPKWLVCCRLQFSLILLKNHGHPLAYPIHPVLYLPRGCSNIHEIMLWYTHVWFLPDFLAVLLENSQREHGRCRQRLFFHSFLLCPCDTLCSCAKGHTWSGDVSLICNIIGCPVCGIPRANSYPCWTLRSGNWMCCSRRLPSVLCSLFPSSKCPMSSHSWKCSVQMPKHHSSIVTW